MYTWDEILDLDPYSNLPCEWCEKSMILSEAVIEGEDIDNIFLLCGFCAGYDTQEEMEAAKATIITNAINPELSEEYKYPWV